MTEGVFAKSTTNARRAEFVYDQDHLCGQFEVVVAQIFNQSPHQIRLEDGGSTDDHPSPKMSCEHLNEIFERGHIYVDGWVNE